MANQDNDKDQPKISRVEDKDDLTEEDLKTNYLFGNGKMKSATAPGMESQGMGGQHFGENNLTRSGNDQANPPRYAGESNAYFNRTEPSEEHPENENFKPAEQQGEPNIPGPNELPDQQKVGEDQQPAKGGAAGTGQGYQEGTADSDGK